MTLFSLLTTLALSGLASCGSQDAIVVDPSDSVDSSEAELAAGKTVLTLYTGQILSGFLANVYDHSRWYWTPSNELTYALLIPARFRTGEDDLSYRFISSNDVKRVRGPVVSPVPAVLDFTRSIGMVLSRPPLDGVSYVYMGNDHFHLREDGFGEFAWDLEVHDASGVGCRGTCAQNSDFLCWGEPVYLPVDGTVVEVQRDFEDNTPGVVPANGFRRNNLVAVEVAGRFQLWLLHFKKGSVPASIVPGARLSAGTFIGRVGNSGFSIAPHLHVEASWIDPVTNRGWGVPVEFESFYSSRSLREPGRYLPNGVPRAGDYVSGAPF